MLPITRVTLYTSGVGYFERGGPVEGEAQITLFFPIGQVNDVLKSLVLLDSGGGEISPVTYAAQDPVLRALQAFSLDISDDPDRATLLGRMRGVSVTLTTDDPAPLTGIIAGVETRTVYLDSNGGGTSEQSWLTLLAGDSLHTVPLDSVRGLQINDAALAGELRGALAAVAQGRDAGKRPVTLTFRGEGSRTVQVGYLLEAPAWQTSYRLVLGETPRLQGWALVQNTGQDDWSEAHLSLVSGRPISFIQDLYTPLYVHRPTVQPRIAASPTPQTYDSDMAGEEQSRGMMLLGEVSAGADFGMAAPASPPATLSRRRIAGAEAPAPLSPGQAALGSVAATGAALGTAFAYHIDVPVSVPRQQSAMIPFVSAPVEAERVSVYNSRVQAGHPLAGVRLKNITALHLMGGPLTVFDTPENEKGGGTAGYVGDALMDDTEAGQMRLLTYALDLAVDADARPDRQSSSVSEVRLAQGTLRVRQTSQQVVEYVFKNHSAEAKTLVLEHPIQAGWELMEPAAPAERTATEYRFERPLSGKAAASLRVVTERQVWESLRLLDTAADKYLSYGRAGAAPEAVRAALEDVAARRQRLAEMEAGVAALNAQMAVITQGQERIRKNMEALDHKSDLYRRYVGELDTQETQIASLVADRDTRQTELTGVQAEYSRHLAALTV